MRRLTALTYPGLLLFAASASYVLVRGQATREILSLLLATSFGTGELIVSVSAAVNGGLLMSVLPRLLNAIGAFILAGAIFSQRSEFVLTVGSVVLFAGLVLWTRQMRRDARERSERAP